MTDDTNSEQQSGRPTDPVRSGRGPRKRRRLLVGLLLGATCVASVLAGVTIGYLLGSRPTASSPSAASEQPAAVTWTCSMHPQIKLPKPGKCPICFMDLIPLEEEAADDDNPRRLTMSKAAEALADVQTVPVRRQYVIKPVRMVGKVDYDETRMADITARVPGRLDRLFVDYTGITVRKGEHLVWMYSPDLVVAQRELLQAWEAYNLQGAQQDDRLVETTLQAAEAKLRLLGLLDEQIEEIKGRGTPSDHLTIYAPVGGIVIRKHLNEGIYVQTGSKIYTIADLAQVWVYLDAYESDVPWIRYGPEVEFTTEAYPGDLFRGRVAFIDPMLNEKTRTVRVRLNVPNEDLRLKPGMFVRAIVRSRLAAGGRVLDASLAGKWLCSMHLEVVKDEPGSCDVCGMDLVPAESLGLVAEHGEPEPPLVIPASGPLITGKRAVVYVKVPGTQQPTFEGREVLLGHRAGDYYIVRDGLRENEQVVTQGNFKIDSALQLLPGKLSMMGTAGPPPLEVPAQFRRQLDAVYEPYLKFQTALADDRLDDARVHWAAMRAALDRIPTETIDPRVGQSWQQMRRKLDERLASEPEQADVDALRVRFEGVAAAMLEMVEVFGHALAEPLYEAYCPMAFNNRGAPWLQATETVDNPYFGHKMKRCGTIRRQFAPALDTSAKEDRP